MLLRKRFFRGVLRGSELKDIVWFTPAGKEMICQDGTAPRNSLGMPSWDTIQSMGAQGDASSATPSSSS